MNGAISATGAVSRTRSSLFGRVGWGLLAATGLAGVVLFVATHPLGAGWATAGIALYVGLIALRRDAWLVGLPALLPVADLAPWTGMIYLTESDALVCATLFAVALRAATAAPTPTAGPRELRFGPIQWVLVALMGASYLVSTDWGELLALAWDPNLLVGYESPLNGPRLVKGFVLAVLLLPLLAEAFRRDSRAATARIGTGMLASLLVVSAAGLWERLAFPGLSDFASDYRITALFWEMNVGGATLDGWLALTLPFLFAALLRRGPLPRLAALMMLVSLAGYVTFTTFSRGLYLGAALGIAVTLALAAWRARDAGGGRLRPGRVATATVLAMIFFGLLSGVFQTGGYRALLAAYGLAGVVFLAAPLVRGQPARGIVTAFAIAMLASIASFAAMAWIPKGVYLSYAASVLCFAAFAAVHARSGERLAADLALGCVPWAAVNLVLVGVFWGGEQALAPGLFAALGLLLPLVALRIRPALAWQVDAHRLAWAGVALGVVAAAVVGFNSYYATQRFSTVGEDLAGRIEHWSAAAALPQPGAERILGIGTGRFSARYFWSAPDNMIPGNHRIESDAGNRYLRLGGPRHVLGFGELFRVSQRVDYRLQPPFQISLLARAPEENARVHLEICRKHLLYTQECTGATLTVPGGGAWTQLAAGVESLGLGGGGTWLPRLTYFSVANQSRGRLLDVDEITLIDARGRMLLANGDFSAGTERWFFSSDHHHLPWHAKNLWLHYYVEQGWFGALAFSLVALAALFRVTVGGGRSHPLAAPLAGGILACLAVGMFDSLVDAPRLTLLLFFALFVALGLRSRRGSPAPGAPDRPAR